MAAGLGERNSDHWRSNLGVSSMTQRKIGLVAAAVAVGAYAASWWTGSGLALSIAGPAMVLAAAFVPGNRTQQLLTTSVLLFVAGFLAHGMSVDSSNWVPWPGVPDPPSASLLAALSVASFVGSFGCLASAIWMHRRTR